MIHHRYDTMRRPFNLPATYLFDDIKTGIVKNGSIRLYLLRKIKYMQRCDTLRPNHPPMRLGFQA